MVSATHGYSPVPPSTHLGKPRMRIAGQREGGREGGRGQDGCRSCIGACGSHPVPVGEVAHGSFENCEYSPRKLDIHTTCSSSLHRVRPRSVASKLYFSIAFA